MSPQRGPTAEPVLGRRRAGVLLHPTSLPGAARDGALGDVARHFVDWLVAGGFSVWQLLPLGPVGPDRSPYFARSNHAGNPGLLDLAALERAGLLPSARERAHVPHAGCVAQAAAALLASRGAAREAYDAFVAAERDWLCDYALFTAIQARESGRPWWEWSVSARDRDASALAGARRTLAAEIECVQAGQFFFHSQWRELRAHANAQGVKLFGDIPIYVAPDSVEVWANRALFQLDAAGLPTAVAGVPPDFFSADGQLWGNPLYRWEEHERTGFAWWLGRLRAQFALYDLLRIDHFRGLEAYWSVPAGAATAKTGRWVVAHGEALLSRAREAFAALAVVAEDLGVITPEVERLRDGFALPGMRVLQFGFDGTAGNVHALHEWTANAVGYTGTHDNDTTAGWFASLRDDEKHRVREYLDCADAQVVAQMVRVVTASVARLSVVPLQDLLGLGSTARMNLPGTTESNWAWGFEWSDVPPDLAERCRRRNATYGRCD
ncbi:MAG: 4-alpha-glucanotransferase [Pseudomonadota bacterium]